MTPIKLKTYLRKQVIEEAKFKRKQLLGYKSQITHAYNKGEIKDAERAMKNKQIDDARFVLNQYIKYYENKLKTIKGSGLKRKQRGGNVIFFNNPKELLKKLEIDNHR